MPGFGRRFSPDDRDRGFLMRRMLADARTVALPVRKTWRIASKALQQGKTGTCVGHAWRNFLRCEPDRTTDPEPSAFDIYRDAVGLGVDSAMAVYSWYIPTAALFSSRGVAVVNSRSLLLDQIADSRKSALDYYVFVRNAYVQYRQALVEDRRTTDRQREEGTDEDLYRILPGY